MKNRRLYSTWRNMLYRCNNPKDINYPRYGKKGTKVCPQWESFQIFQEWAYANGYTDNLIIGRIDHAYGYSPDNCKWITKNENLRDRFNSLKPKKIELNDNSCIMNTTQKLNKLKKRFQKWNKVASELGITYSYICYLRRGNSSGKQLEKVIDNLLSQEKKK